MPPYTIPSSVISPGSVYQPRQRPILNRISGAIAAWSTRRLISSAPADIARGRDALTNEQDFTATELAGSGFTDLAGANDGFYVTLYDQIGSNNATQSTAASQPKGVDTGSLITDGAGVPALRLDGVDDGFDAANQTSVKSLFVRLKTSDTKFILGCQPGLIPYFLNVESGNTSTSFDRFSGSSVSYYVNGALQSWTNRNDAYLAISTGEYITIAITGLDLSSYTTGLSLFYNSFYAGYEMSGDVTDIITFGHDLTAGEITQLHTALI